MVSINTNLSSFIAQRSLNNSTNRLNLAIERMTTGYKINHAGDNAANYSISNDMETKLGAYEVAQNNIAMGTDMLSTAEDTASLLQEHASRIHALITQAQNGTYGDASLAAINAEVQARIDEIDRIYANAEYNGIKLFEGFEMPDWTQEVKANAGMLNGKSLEQCAAENNGFIGEVDYDTPEVIIYEASQLANALNTKTKIGIGSAEALAELAYIVSGTGIYTGEGNDCSGKTIILTEDIDLSAICAKKTNRDGSGGWTPIGRDLYSAFAGTFNGNGHKVSGLYIKLENSAYLGLFGYTTGEIKNVEVEGAVAGKDWTGMLVGNAYGAITNCYATGNVSGQGSMTGGLVGSAWNTITNCYATGSVSGKYETGGLVGDANGAITNCYATGDVLGQNHLTGGLVGTAWNTITNCYATGNVSGQDTTGGLAGDAEAITNCYATGNVSGQNETGGLVGDAYKTITNCYATGNVSGQNKTGGLAGYAEESITNCYAKGNVSGKNWIGGITGQIDKRAETLNLENICSFGTVSGTDKVGSFIGGIIDTYDKSSFGTITIKNASAVLQEIPKIGFEGASDETAYSSGQMDGWLANIKDYNLTTTLQVGIYGDKSSQISINTAFNYNISQLSVIGAQNEGAYDIINKFLETLSDYATKIGAARNRLDSALESTETQIRNLVSSHSTIKDADIAKESSKYIQQQILQQAAATLLSTANQSPSIALQLI